MRVNRKFRNIIFSILGMILFAFTVYEGAPNVFVKGISHQSLEPDLNVFTITSALLSVLFLLIVLVDLFKRLPKIEPEPKGKEFLSSKVGSVPADTDA